MRGLGPTARVGWAVPAALELCPLAVPPSVEAVGSRWELVSTSWLALWGNFRADFMSGVFFYVSPGFPLCGVALELLSLSKISVFAIFCGFFLLSFPHFVDSMTWILFLLVLFVSLSCSL